MKEEMKYKPYHDEVKLYCNTFFPVKQEVEIKIM